MDPEVIFCDNHLLLLNKPAGLLTQPNQTTSSSLEAWGKQYLKKRFEKPGNVFLEAVHRLDRPVSGLVLCARTSKALSRLQQAQRENLFQKEYLALVEGSVSDGEFTDCLEHGDRRAFVSTKGKLSRLKFRALKKIRDYTLVQVTLLTGRYHQIRVQFASRGHPILGDHKYGSTHASKTLFLHHYAFTFPHPISGETLTYSAALPPSWSTYVGSTFARSSHS
ncbi:MAG: Ribosomal large subunit pseudouridine synthase C [Chlamydiales bacterium]|nr:Ribosomal large subunit pseudouridine synthase C [Chlamydiales bacterium]